MNAIIGHTLKLAAIVSCITLALVPRGFSQSDLHKSLQDHITKTMGKGWVASPHGADTRFRPKTMFIYLDDLQKRYEGKGEEKGWVPFSSGLSIFPEEYVPIQSEKVSLATGSAEDITKLGFFASVQKALSELGLNASVKAELVKNWNVKIEIDEAEKEWVWQDEMRIAQEITGRNAERMAEVLKARYEKVPPVIVIIGALRVKGLAAVVESTRTDSVEFNAELTQYLAKLGLN